MGNTDSDEARDGTSNSGPDHDFKEGNFLPGNKTNSERSNDYGRSDGRSSYYEAFSGKEEYGMKSIPDGIMPDIFRRLWAVTSLSCIV